MSKNCSKLCPAGRCRAAIIVALAAVSMTTLSGCSRGKAGSAGGAQTLIIVSPNGQNIRREFTHAFKLWYAAKYHQKVHVEWPTVGGTNNCVKVLSIKYASAKSSGYDLFFGGGSAVFNMAMQRGWLARPHLPAKVITVIPKTLNGVELRAPGNRWVGSTMSYFGMVVNRRLLAAAHMPTPRTWQDLTGPKFIGQLSLGDPSGSGSVRTCYEMVLQQYGWTRGWGILERMFGACRQIQTSGSDPAEEVGQGNAMAGVVIDFFGRLEMAKVGAKIVRFIVPRGGSALDSDPIAMLKGAPHPLLARRFMAFVLSSRGQKLWVFRRGTPGGPQHHALGRMSVLPNLYKHDARYMTDPTDPFAAPPPLKVNEIIEIQRSVFLGDLMAAALINNHAALEKACRLVAKKGNPPKLLAMFNQPPFPANQTAAISKRYLSGQRAQERLKTQWRNMYAKRFAHIIRAAGG